MKRPLDVFLPVGDGDADALLERFLEDPETWLGADARRAGPGAWHVDLTGLGFTREVECRVGPPWRAGSAAWRAIEWIPLGTDRDVVPLQRLLPRLEAELGLARQGGRTSLVLSGSYEVPASALGAAADMAGLALVARRTGTRFLTAVRDLLSAPAPAPL